MPQLMMQFHFYIGSFLGSFSLLRSRNLGKMEENSPGLMQDRPQMPSHKHFLRGLRQSSSARHFLKHVRPYSIFTIELLIVIQIPLDCIKTNGYDDMVTDLCLGQVFIPRARIWRYVARIFEGFLVWHVFVNWKDIGPRLDEDVVVIVRFVAAERAIGL